MASGQVGSTPIQDERHDTATSSRVSLGSARMPPARSLSSMSLVPPVTPFDLPTATELRIGESPYPTIAGSSHSQDPFGLNAYLMHPEDRMWSYLHLDPAAPVKGMEDMPAALRRQTVPAPALPTREAVPADGDSGAFTAEPETVDAGLQEQSRSRSTFRLSGLLNKALKRQKSENSLLAVRQLGHVVRPEEQGGSCQSSTLSPKLLDNGTLLLPSTSKPTTPSSDTSDLPSLSSSMSSPIPLSAAHRSRSANSTGSSASSAKSEGTGGSDGIITPADRDVLGLTVLTMEDLKATHAKLSNRVAEQEAEDALVLEVAAEPKRSAERDHPSVGRTNSPSGWKGWLISGGKKQASKIVEVKPTKLNVDAAPQAGLSADPTAGILPSSVSPTSIAAHSEELHLPAKTLASLPAPVKYLRNMSIDKMSALRSAASHPVMLDQNLPRHLSIGRRSTSVSPPMRFPRSVNMMRRPGEGLIPAESGMRIDIGVRRLLQRIDRAHQEDIEAIRSMVLRRRKTIPPVTRRTRDPGICLFLERPPFEERIEVISGDGEISLVESAGDRAVEEIQFSVGIVALAQAERERILRNIQNAARRSGARWNSFDASQQRRERPPVIVEESETASARTTPSPNMRSTSSDAVPRAIARRQSTNGFDSPPSVPARNKSSPDLSALRPRRFSTLRTVNTTWEVSSSSESEETDQDEDKPLSSMRKPAGPPIASARPASWAPSSSVRHSVSGVPSRQSMMSVESAPAARHRSRPTQAEEEYKALVAKARERRQEARSGETERRAGAEALAAAETLKRTSRVSSSAAQRTSQSAPASPSQRTPGSILHSESRESLTRASARPNAHRSSTSSASLAMQGQLTGPPPPLTRRSLSQHDLLQSSASYRADPRQSMVFPSLGPMVPMAMVPAPMLSPTGMFMPMPYSQVMVPASGYMPVMMPASAAVNPPHMPRGMSRGQADPGRHSSSKARSRSPIR